MSSQITVPLSNDELRALDPHRSHRAWSTCLEMAAKEAKMDYGVEDLKQNMFRSLGLYENRENADLTLVCASKTFKIHSFVLCPRSPFFRAAFEGGFKEEIAKAIELPEDDPYLISKLICYCYTTDYTFEGDEGINIEPKRVFCFSLLVHAGMYTLAEKYDLKNLKNVAETKFRTSLQQFKPNVTQASPVDSTLTGVLEVIQVIYNTTPENDRGLRDIVVGYMAQHLTAFLALQHFKTFVAANAEFIIDVIEAREFVGFRYQANSGWEEIGSLESHHGAAGW